jgi:hypothetical protein
LLKQANLTIPLDTGKLKNSGKTSIDKSNKEAAISYDTDYAVRVHESVGRRYNQKGIRKGSRRVRRAKWLELTLNEKSNQVGKRIQKIFKKYL